MKTIAILLALINSLAAGAVIAGSLPAIHILRPAAAVWSAMKVALSICIIGAGILTWIAACRITNQGLMFVTGLFLVALGTGSAVWTIQVAVSGGDLRDGMFLYGGSLLVQGASSLWNLLPAGRATTGI